MYWRCLERILPWYISKEIISLLICDNLLRRISLLCVAKGDLYDWFLKLNNSDLGQKILRNIANSSVTSYGGELITMSLKDYFHYSMLQKGNANRCSPVLLYFVNTVRTFHWDDHTQNAICCFKCYFQSGIFILHITEIIDRHSNLEEGNCILKK